MRDRTPPVKVTLYDPQGAEEDSFSLSQVSVNYSVYFFSSKEKGEWTLETLLFVVRGQVDKEGHGLSYNFYCVRRITNLLTYLLRLTHCFDPTFLRGV